MLTPSRSSVDDKAPRRPQRALCSSSTSFSRQQGRFGSDPPERTLPVYRLQEHIPKRDATAYEVLVNNFERVEEGALFATIGGEPQLAEEAFYPVLMSAEGYASSGMRLN